jgi:hypothetical protein
MPTVYFYSQFECINMIKALGKVGGVSDMEVAPSDFSNLLPRKNKI